jgi:hypothetical protein
MATGATRFPVVFVDQMDRLYSAGKEGLKEAITARKASIVTWESRGQKLYTSIEDYMEK